MLDSRVLHMRIEKLNQIFGRETATKLRISVRIYQDGHQLLSQVSSKEEALSRLNETWTKQYKPQLSAFAAKNILGANASKGEAKKVVKFTMND